MTLADPFGTAQMHDNQTALHSPSDLMAKPALTWDEFWLGILGLPDTTANEIVRGDESPAFFLIGRRRFIRTVDAIAWLDRMAKVRAYTPRRNNCRGATK